MSVSICALCGAVQGGQQVHLLTCPRVTLIPLTSDSFGIYDVPAPDRLPETRQPVQPTAPAREHRLTRLWKDEKLW